MLLFVFFGEATCEEGAFYESLNYASVHQLPVLFVCENNLYSTESPLSTRQPAGTELCERVRSFKITAEKIDGNDVNAVYDQTSKALREIRAGKGPFFIEFMTYRWREHVGPYFDHEQNRNYRSLEELNQWMQQCPIKRSAQFLLQNKFASVDELNTWEAETKEKVLAEVSQAKQTNWPEAATLFENVM